MQVTVGVDFGTLSGRAVVVSVADGTQLADAVHDYRHGVLDRTLPDGSTELAPDWALQLPEDWREVLRTAVPKALALAGVTPDQVIGIGTDFTACTVLPTTADGTPLCELPGLAGRPHAYPKLWRHHAAQPQADRINALAARLGEPWPARYGGKVSSEWQYAKGLQLLEEEPELYARADRWIEAADWIVWELTGAENRNVCTAGYKGMVQDGVPPSREFLARLHPGFAEFTAKLDHPLSPLGAAAGTLTARAAAMTGLNEGIPVSVGNVDAHVTSAAARALEPGHLLAIMGTSTCHILNSEVLAEVPGMCGVVDGGVVPGLWGYEAGQSGVGDIFAWAVRSTTPAEYAEQARARGISVHQLLTEKAAAQPVGGHGLVALDWHSGNRSTLVDHHLSGLLLGLTLDTRPEEIYRALLEATAFGTRMIVEAFEHGGVPVTEFTVAGGLPRNRFLMQIYSDVLRRPINVIGSEQGPALGSAIHAAVAAGAYPDIRAASAAMGRIRLAVHTPDQYRADAYDQLFAHYRELHDHFGRGGSDSMHRLRALRDTARLEENR
ncbi:ribulokinase [Streptacidiphilus sp. P02-A3a]|uniref:ribulokinase n=1 Tax=Streptacidiphilus sp. P02-A3a TaxID=2704468 RepID=UPI0015FBFD2D|nr:ribulokinase [Streptacidiphilus sp. P02-A3a]QMU71410.1 ribulokinase [Streptacidiphilus sp. P02-A3a]